MDILGIIGMLVVVPVNRGPPERPALDGGVSDDREDELSGPGGAKGAMGKVAMVKASDGGHADNIEEEGGAGGDPAPTDEKHGQATGVEEDEWDAAAPVDGVGFGAGGFDAFGEVIGVEPSQDGAAVCRIGLLDGMLLYWVRCGHEVYPPLALLQMQVLFEESAWDRTYWQVGGWKSLATLGGVLVDGVDGVDGQWDQQGAR